MAGAFNIVKKRVKGVQAAGIGNFSPVETKGLQVAGLFNYSRNLKGVQIGFINVADTSSGASIGVFNFIRGGYNKLLISNNELTNINIAYKMGTAAFHTSIIGGLNVFPDQKAFVFGIGFGHDFPLKNRLLLTTELSSQNVFLGNWKELSNLYRAKALLNIPLSERLGLFVGPAFNVFVNDQITPVDGYKTHFPFANYRGKQFNSTIKGWLGWEVGISLF